MPITQKGHKEKRAEFRKDSLKDLVLNCTQESRDSEL